MKSNNMLIGLALLFFALTAIASASVWSEVSLAVKVGMYALGFCTGVAAGAVIIRQKEISK